MILLPKIICAFYFTNKGTGAKLFHQNCAVQQWTASSSPNLKFGIWEKRIIIMPPQLQNIRIIFHQINCVHAYRYALSTVQYYVLLYAKKLNECTSTNPLSA